MFICIEPNGTRTITNELSKKLREEASIIIQINFDDNSIDQLKFTFIKTYDAVEDFNISLTDLLQEASYKDHVYEEGSPIDRGRPWNRRN